MFYEYLISFQIHSIRYKCRDFCFRLDSISTLHSNQSMCLFKTLRSSPQRVGNLFVSHIVSFSCIPTPCYSGKSLQAYLLLSSSPCVCAVRCTILHFTFLFYSICIPTELRNGTRACGLSGLSYTIFFLSWIWF